MSIPHSAAGGIAATPLVTDLYLRRSDPFFSSVLLTQAEGQYQQTTILTNQRVAVNLQMQQMTASVELIKALGGGWNASQLPSPKELGRETAANTKTKSVIIGQDESIQHPLRGKPTFPTSRLLDLRDCFHVQSLSGGDHNLNSNQLRG